MKLLTGDITLDTEADLLVATVNCVGVMGKGVALSFRERWPEIFARYKLACDVGDILPGGCLIMPLPDGRWWAALATKGDWRQPSRYDWVAHGLSRLNQDALVLASTLKLDRPLIIALPAPGCGNGGLDWNIVRPIVRDKLTSHRLRVYTGEWSEKGA